MKTVTLGLYDSFRCLASDCTSTCCAGWKIKVAAEDYNRFLSVEPLALREDILSHIQQRENGYFFQNCENGRCAMLDEDGLCRIQRNLGEKALCNTCRKYPRLIYAAGDRLFLSMAASCPVTARYLVRDQVRWKEDGVAFDVKKRFAHHWETVGKLALLAEAYASERSNTDSLYPCFEKLADAVLGLAVQYGAEESFLLLLQAFAQDNSERIFAFCEETSAIWQALKENYLRYRIFTRWIEFPKEETDVCVRQVLGELLVLRMVAFCRYIKREVLAQEDWEQLICMTYRFCAHGRALAEAFEAMLGIFFSQPCLWQYFLL